jgi:hypothetical protein
MKTPEDEAFEEIERRQSGGFPAKRAMAADKLQEPVMEREALKLAKDVLLRLIQLTNHDDEIYEAVDKCEVALAQQPLPAQEPVAWMYQCTADNSGPVLLRHKTNWAESGTGLWIETPLYTALPLPVQPVQEPVKLWLWRNFVDGKPEYWAFDNPFPIFIDSHDPQTIGEPCGYAWFKPSRAGKTDVTDEEVLRDVQAALAQPAQEPLHIVQSNGKHSPLLTHMMNKRKETHD